MTVVEKKTTTKKHQNDEKETQRREHERVKASYLLSVVCQASRPPSLSELSRPSSPCVPVFYLWGLDTSKLMTL